MSPNKESAEPCHQEPVEEFPEETAEQISIRHHRKNSKNDVKPDHIKISEPEAPMQKVPTVIVWRNVILFVYLHIASVYGIYLMITDAMWKTWLWAYCLYILSGMGVTAGAHRLWAHRAYKARLPLRIYLSLVNALAFQNHIYEWARDHRVHHKFSETDADPHNAKRGFFFAHMGWLLCRKHPEVVRRGKTVDMTDLERDPVVMFQRKYYLPLVILMCFVMPMFVPRLWGESLWNGFWICSIFRYCFQLHATWLVNSAAHLWGDKPYDEFINPAENTFVVSLTMGEGFHNYHHTFPWDYSTSEWGWNSNMTTFFIDLWAWLGLAYDLKRVPQNIIDRRRELKGDGTKPWYTSYTQIH